MMHDSKPWYMSVGMWGGMFAFGAMAMKSFMGVDFDVVGMDAEVVAFIGAAMALWGRFTAKKTLTWS